MNIEMFTDVLSNGLYYNIFLFQNAYAFKKIVQIGIKQPVKSNRTTSIQFPVHVYMNVR